ncbi:pyruvate kinase [Synchytrium microbalum]|uniref:Pyruvate kinase n=1 Tax=Synchytrium microbalum TaxID=1806994 RepID=A0A507BLC5_9FUNG|nr:pyruvate kinase [Synchytrium microbalum]TPX30537.1 pyruvate kinase [Synchytrium microbalum]
MCPAPAFGGSSFDETDHLDSPLNAKVITIPPPVKSASRPRQHPLYLTQTHEIMRTKVVATIGPASSSKKMLAEMIEAGMNVARLNLSHCTHEFAQEAITNIRSILTETNSTAEVGIWVDINGPKVRTGSLKDEKPVFLKGGDSFFFINDVNEVGDNTKISTTYTKELVSVGDKMYIDDGLLSFTVVERLPNSIRTIVDNSGWLGENKGINFPSYIIEELPAVSPKDEEDILFAIKLGVDFLSVSCIRNVSDVEEVRILLGNSKVKLLSKIENQRGMENYEAILRLSDGIVIDRGYLGAEVDVEIVTTAQKRMVTLANTAGKPILVANQMLESMRSHPRPSRAEAADVANAVMDGVDGLVLSAETAVGLYVVETINIMRRICLNAERSTNYLEFQARLIRNIPKPIPVSESIASSAVTCARQVNAAVLVSVTELGGTARLTAKYRPLVPVIGAVLHSQQQTARQLALNFGIIPYTHTGDEDSIVTETLRFATELGICKAGDVAIVTAGQQIGFMEGTTTRMQILSIPSFE